MDTIEIKDAKTFLREISLENENHFGSMREFIFRGQRDADWEIIPTAFRKKSKLFYESGFFLPEIGERSNRIQIYAEFHTLETFCNELNINGFHIPNEDTLNLDGNIPGHNEFTSKIGRCEGVWPPKKYHSILGVAQHYGVPTRFVDWSYDPFVAAYFAAIDSVKSQHTGFLSVFAANTFLSNIRQFGFEHQFFEEENEEGIISVPRFLNYGKKIYQQVKAPSFFNANLKAQKGLFIVYVDLEFRANDIFIPYSFEQYLQDSKDENNNASYKYIICASKAEELLFLLNKRFYNSGSLFPNIEGCVRSIFESRHLV
jgi:hypothetical protein